MTLLRCNKCGEEKDENEFHYRKTAGYREVRCARCKHARNLERDPLLRFKAALSMRRRDASRAGLPFTITLNELLPLPSVCPVLGIPLAHGPVGGSDCSPSIDRIIPSLGYVPGNVIVISLKANRIKNDATPAELRAVADFFAGISNAQNFQEIAG